MVLVVGLGLVGLDGWFWFGWIWFWIWLVGFGWFVVSR
jgi:hypothetical protein